jgi:hypothetical protein
MIAKPDMGGTARHRDDVIRRTPIIKNTAPLWPVSTVVDAVKTIKVLLPQNRANNSARTPNVNPGA